MAKQVIDTSGTTDTLAAGLGKANSNFTELYDFKASLGSPTTIGLSVLGLVNPSAITFPRFNADNTVDALSAANMRTALGLAIGTDVQAYSATLAAIVAGTYTGAASITTLGTIATGVWSGTAIAVAKGGTGATDAATARTNLGLGTIATQADSAVALTGGTITGLTNLGVSMANNTAITGIALGTISDTTSRPLTITQTWNNAGLTAKALVVNVTSTASAAGSLLADFQVGGTSMVGVHKNGYLTINSTASPYYMMYIDTTRFINTASGTTVCIGTTGVSVECNTSTLHLAGSIAFGATYAGTQSTADAYLRRAGAASLQLGADSATPIAQTFGFCSGVGTNIAGANAIIRASNGTGTGGSGKLIWQVAAAGSTGSTANTFVNALELDKDRVFFVANTNAAPSGTPSGGGCFYVEAGALKFKGSSGTVTTIAAA